MEFQNKEIMKIILNNLPVIGEGSQGICYYNEKTKEVYKIFHHALEDNNDDYINYTKEELLRFSNVKNKTFMWAKDTISVEDEVVGYVNNYIEAKSLYAINPLKINLNKLSNCINLVRKDIKIISDSGIKTYDLMYNILYGNRFYVTDFDEFSYSDLNPKILQETNNRNFDYELYYFLIEGYFDEFIKQYKVLKKMYEEKQEDILIFIDLLKKYLSEYMDKEINSLSETKKCLNKAKQIDYVYKRNVKL